MNAEKTSNDSPKTFSDPHQTLKAENNYPIAYTDTISLHTNQVLRKLAQSHRNPLLVSEITEGLNDTRENPSQSTFPVPIMRKKRKSKFIPDFQDKSASMTSRTPFPRLSIKPKVMPTTFDIPKLAPLPSHCEPKAPSPTQVVSTEVATPPEDSPASTTPTLAILDPIAPKTSSEREPNTNSENIDKIKINEYAKQENLIQPGDIIAGKYEIIHEIARGGFGVIYRAIQLGINRVVALKQLHNSQNDAFSQRFLLEANIIKALIHPNTIQLIDVGVDRQKLFFVMEFIEGQSLKDLIKTEKSLPFQRTVNITRQILKSINEAHHRGVIHRDLKPSNILLRNIFGETDFVKVLDFGIAKVKNKSMPKLTMQGKIMGTPQYLAPELFMGDEASPTSDIFAVGLIMLEMLTGKAPLPSDILGITKIVTSPEYIDVPDWIRQSALGAFILKAIERDPKNRFQTAGEMLAELNRLENETLRRFYQTMIPALPPRLAPRKSLKFVKGTIAVALFLLTNALLIYHFVL